MEPHVIKICLWDVAINPSVIVEGQLLLVAKCNLNPLLDVAVDLSDNQLPLAKKCNFNPLWDVDINLYMGNICNLSEPNRSL